jgi:putative transposase
LLSEGGQKGDNAAMESFFLLLQKHVLDRRFWTARSWTTREQLRISIVAWIERIYHLAGSPDWDG